MQGQGTAALIIVRQITPVLHCSRGFAAHPEAIADTNRRGLYHLVHIAALEGTGQNDVATHVIMQHRRIRFGGGNGIDHRAQLFIADGNPLHRVFRQITALRRHGDNRLTNKTYF